jgi:hypothetical protein
MRLPVRSSRENYNTYQRDLMRRRRAAKKAAEASNASNIPVDLEDAILEAKGLADWLVHNHAEATMFVLAAFNALPEAERVKTLRRSSCKLSNSLGEQLSDALRLLEGNGVLAASLFRGIDKILAIAKGRPSSPPPSGCGRLRTHVPLRRKWVTIDKAAEVAEEAGK